MKRHHPLILHIFHAFLLLFLTIKIQSLNFQLGIESTFLTVLEKFEQNVLKLYNEEQSEDYLFINTTYSKEFIPKLDEYGLYEVGKEVITSRSSLANFLEFLNKNIHKYAILDVFMIDRHPLDSLVNVRLSEVEHLIIPYHIENGVVLKPEFEANYGLGDIYALRGMVNRYSLTQGEHKSIPLRIYEDLNDVDLKPKGTIGKIGGRWLTNSFPLNFRIRNYNIFEEENEGQKVWNYYEMETFLSLGKDFASSITEDKIIVVGDFEQDQFDSNVGNISGPLILLNAYLSLEYNEPFLSIWYLLFILVAFFVLSYSSLFKVQSENGKKSVQLLKPLKLSLFIIGISAFSYLVFGKYISIFFLGMYVLVIEYLMRIVLVLSRFFRNKFNFPKS